MSGAGDYWVIVQSFAGAEWQAYRGLLRRGIESYLPCFLGDSRRGRWVQGTVRPQYQGYLFAMIDETHSIEDVKQTVGVQAVVRNGPEIVQVSPDQLQSCRRQCGELYRETVPVRFERRQWKLGEWLPIPFGPFANIPAEITEVDKSGRIKLSIGSLSVVVHASDLAASPHSAVRASA